MLVLTREQGETIVITSPDGTEIVVTAVAIRGNKLRIGIDAPRVYSVHRAEVQEKINRKVVTHT